MKKLLCTVLSVILLVSCLAIGAEAQAQQTSSATLLEGKTLSILGDSISAYPGLSNGTAADTTNSTIRDNKRFYPSDFLDDPNDTWWMQAVDVLGAELLVNNSWAGSYLLKDRVFADGITGYGAWQDRCVQLHDDTGDNAGQKPDIIAFYMGTNDFNYDHDRIGSYDTVDFDALITGSAGAYTYAEPTTAMEAYAICLHKIRQTYPDAEVYCFTILPRRGVNLPQPDAFNGDLIRMAERFGCYVVDLYNDSGITNDIAPFGVMIGDEVHPSVKGMDAITAAFVSAVLENSKYISDSTVVHRVSYDLAGVNSISGKPGTVVGNAPLTVELMGSAAHLSVGEVSVTMGGVDITENCYADGVISIPTVTADVQISAKSVRNVPEHTHTCEHCEGAGEWIPWEGNVEQLYFGGHYYLTEDTTMNDDFYSESIVNPEIDVTICLNGKTLYGPAAARMFRLSRGAKINIVDCTAKTENGTYTAGRLVPVYHEIRGVVVGVFGTGESAFNVYDGIIDGGKNSNTSAVNADSVGGGLLDIATASGKINLYGGVLKDYTSYYGGAIYAPTGTVNLENVTIENTSAACGGAIYAGTGARVSIKDGSILNCTATAAANAGGAIYTEAAAKTVDGVEIPGMTIDGTLISGCKAPNGGGGAFMLLNKAVVEMKSGKITGSEASWKGEAIRLPGTSAVFIMSGGEITENTSAGESLYIKGTFNLTGGKIYNNTNGTGVGYEVVVDGGTATISGGEIAATGAVQDGDAKSRALYVGDKSTVNITDGTINGVILGPANITGGNFDNGAVYGTPTITGGTFGYDVSSKLTGEYEQYPNGKVGLPCEHPSYKDGLCENCGEEDPNPEPTPDYNGLVEVDGVWGYYVDGVLQTDFTGLVDMNGTWFYVENGLVNWDYNGLILFNGVWFYVNGGCVEWGYTGLVLHNGYWMYVSGGMVDWEYVGLTQYNGWWFYVANGFVDWEYVGMTCYNGWWFYVANGLVDWEYNSLTQYNGYWFYIDNGMVDWYYVGLVPFNGALFYVQNGMVDWSYNGTANYGGVEYQVVGGIAQ